MTKFNHSAHVRLWDWLSKNPDRSKRSWPEWKENGGNFNNIKDRCFACEYASELSTLINVDDDCACCPLLWPNGIKCRLYEKYCDATDIAKPALAEQIRDLPVKEGVECE